VICQKCHEREATVFISQTMNQETTKLHLCTECAGEMGPTLNIGPLNVHPFGDFGDFLKDIVAQAQQMGEQIAKNIQLDPSLADSNPFNVEIRSNRMPPLTPPAPGTQNPIPAAAPPQTRPVLQCPHCGYQFSAFQQNGRLGCPRCYESFQQVLHPLITSIHGNVEHVEGETPKAPSNVTDWDAPELDRLSGLKTRLKEAIRKERFEEAAKLRDEIHAMERDDQRK